jgi:hypothetical protein
MSESGWRVLATYASGFEADLAMAQLEAAEIPAVRDSNDSVGIFGPGFRGATARGRGGGTRSSAGRARGRSILRHSHG